MASQPKSTNPFDLDQEELSSMEQVMDSLNKEQQSDFSQGSLIQATILDFDDREVFLDVGLKEDGRCLREEFAEPPFPGAQVPVVVLHGADDGPIRLSRKEANLRVTWSAVCEAFEAGAQLSGEVIRSVNHGYIVEHNGLQLFLPHSQASLKMKGKRIPGGKLIDFKILELKTNHRTAIVSHRAVIEERNDAQWNELLAQHKVDDIVEGVISKKVSFGLFINVAGIEGLLHHSDISWKKFTSFKNRFKLNETLKVKILLLDKENNRLSLGLKQLEENPWDWAHRELEVGGRVHGKVTNVTDYGAFIELKEGLEGLVHVSELTWSKRAKHPKKYLEVDQELEAVVLGLDVENRRLSLGIRQLQEDPWVQVCKEIKVGDILEGRVTSVTKFGSFVVVRDDVEGLIHFGDYDWNDKVDRNLLKKGDVCKFKIMDIHPEERRISCSLKHLSESPYEALAKKYKKGTVIEGKVTGVTSFGIFVQLEGKFEGLVRKTHIPLQGGQQLESMYKEGDMVRAVLLQIDVDEKKISLSIKSYDRKQEQEIMEQYIKKDDNPSTSSPFAAILKKKDP